MRPAVAAALSLAFTGAFFLEYLPPREQVHVPYDLEGFHYPLLNYAFLSLQQGRFPEWDPTIYCGLSFAGNPQAALFYPPHWLLFLAHAGQQKLSFIGLEILLFLHVWAAFLFCYLWLRGRALSGLAGAFGAGVFAFGGYMMSQMQHAGVIMGYAWFPLGLWGVDRAVAHRNWRYLWMVAAASALCFLAGYPPTWFVFAVCAGVYAVVASRRWRVVAAVAAALGISLLAAAVQLLPAIEAARLRTPELKYGGGIRDTEFWFSFFLPNYFDLGLDSRGAADPTGQYFYLGAPALLALLWTARRGLWRAVFPAAALAGVSLVFILNPFGLVEQTVNSSGLLAQLCRDWSFLAGLPLAAALLTGVALHDFRVYGGLPAPRWLAPVAVVALGSWAMRQALVWLPGGTDFLAGWRGAFEPATMLAIFTLGLWTARAEKGSRQAVLAGTLLLATGLDYKVFGTSRRFNAMAGSVDEFYRGVRFRGLDDRVYEEMRAHPEYRVVLDETALPGNELRRYGLTTPQGFDPLLPSRYQAFISEQTSFRTDREFFIAPSNYTLLDRLGARYFLTTTGSPNYASLAADPAYRRLEPAASYFHVFEFRTARPAYRWEAKAGVAEVIAWTPERREFVVRSAGGGQLALIEQFFPGWRVAVDGRDARIEPWSDAFQQVAVGPGEHRVLYEYRPGALRWGAAISVLSIAGVWMLVRKR